MNVLAWMGRAVAGVIVIGTFAAAAPATGIVLLVVWAGIEFAAGKARRARPEDYRFVENLIRAGDLNRALKTLEAVREQALRDRNLERLEDVARLGGSIGGQSSGGTRRRASELVYSANENVRFVRRQLGEPEPAAPPAAVVSQEASVGIVSRLRALKGAVAALAADAERLDPVSPDLGPQLARLEEMLKGAGREVVALRGLLVEEGARRRAEQVAAVPPTPAPKPTPPPPPAPVREPRPSLSERLEGMGSRLFAWAGGIVMLLGVVFLFAFATRRGWIGPEARLVMGGIASTATLLAGLWLRHRYGALQSALAAVGVGLAGLYTTILAAAALYDYLPPLGALACSGAATGNGSRQKTQGGPSNTVTARWMLR